MERKHMLMFFGILFLSPGVMIFIGNRLIGLAEVIKTLTEM